MGVAQFRAAGKQYHIKNRGQLSQSTDDVDRISTGSGTSLESQNQMHKINTKSSPTISSLNPQGANAVNVSSYNNGKSQSDSETASVATTSVPTRISSSSDIGYGSMTEQKPPSDTDVDDRETEETEGIQHQNPRSAKSAKFWGQMGRSLDQWVRSGMTGLANVASYAAETSYYSPASLMITGYQPDYSPRHQQGDYDDDDDDFDEAGGLRSTTRRLNFDDDEREDEKSTNTLRLLRSISFGNDTQIMSKLKELKEDILVEEKLKQLASNNKNVTDGPTRVSGQENGGVQRSGSGESNNSLEGKVTEFYEPSVNSLPRKVSNAREQTPVNGEDDESYQDTLRPNSLNPPPPRSPTLQIRDESRDISREATPCSPARTPVTQNDPLGALSDPCSPIERKIGNKKFTVVPAHPSGSSVNDLRLEKICNDSPKRTCSEGQIGGYVMGGAEAPQGMSAAMRREGAFHRSSTLPNYSTITGITGGTGGADCQPGDEKYGNGTPVVPSLSAISSSLKNPFG